MGAGTGGVAANVIDIRSYQPISGASVTLTGPSSEKTTTAENGDFKFSSLAAGNNYTLEVSAEGYRPERYEDIVVIDGVVTNLGKLPLWYSE